MRWVAVVALLAVIGLGVALWLQSGTVGALRTEKEALAVKVDTLTDQRDQILSSIQAANQNAKRHAETAASLRLQLNAYQQGDCDATDPACAVDYINRILHERKNRLP